MRSAYHLTLFVSVVTLAVVGAFTRPASGQSAPAAVFTAAQAEAGKAHYATTCAACHGADLGGADAPALAGSAFVKAWGTQTTVDLFNYVQGMPPGGTPLPADENLTVVAFILQQNGATHGAAPLQATTSVKIGGIATGKRPPAVASHQR